MVKKKRKDVIVKLSNRWLYTFIVIGILVIVSIGVWALGSVPNPGHAISELQTCDEGETLQVVSGTWSCVSGGGGNLKILTLDIGSWNMDTQSYKIVPVTGISWQNIRGVASVIIRMDGSSDIGRIPLTRGSNSDRFNILDGNYDLTSVDEIRLYRRDGGAFDSASYTSTSVNRGWITIVYTD